MKGAHSRRLKTGWMADIHYRNERGNPVRFRRMIGPATMTAREAEKVTLQLKREADRTGHVPGFNEPEISRETEYPFSGFSKLWFDTYVAPNNRPSEIRNKESTLRVHLVPYFGDADIREIDTLSVERFKAHLFKSGLSKKSVNNYLAHLRKMLNCAADWGYLEAVPKVKAFRIEDEDRDWYTMQERDVFLKTCKTHRPEWYAFFFTAFHTGMRMGEMRALRWEDIDFQGRKIRVRRSRWKEHETTPKGKRSRDVPMNSELVGVLKGHRHIIGPLVFYNSANKPLDENGGRKVFKTVCRLAGLRTISLHSIRHSYASHLVMNTGNIKAVKDTLGHVDMKTTERYAHLTPAKYQEGVETLVTPKSPSEMEHREQETGKKTVNEGLKADFEHPTDKEKARRLNGLRAL